MRFRKTQAPFSPLMRFVSETDVGRTKKNPPKWNSAHNSVLITRTTFVGEFVRKFLSSTLFFECFSKEGNVANIYPRVIIEYLHARIEERAGRCSSSSSPHGCGGSPRSSRCWRYGHLVIFSVKHASPSSGWRKCQLARLRNLLRSFLEDRPPRNRIAKKERNKEGRVPSLILASSKITSSLTMKWLLKLLVGQSQFLSSLLLFSLDNHNFSSLILNWTISKITRLVWRVKWLVPSRFLLNKHPKITSSFYS